MVTKTTISGEETDQKTKQNKITNQYAFLNTVSQLQRRINSSSQQPVHKATLRDNNDIGLFSQKNVVLI